MQQYLDEFVESLKKSLGENLISVVLYGSAAKGEHIPKRSDVNVMVLLKEVSLSCIDSIEASVHRARKKASILPVFWSVKELQDSADVFPIEFQDITENNRVLYGADLLKGIAIDPRNLAHQLEFELRSKLLSLRSEWPKVKGSRSLLADFLARAGTSFLYLFSHVQNLSGDKADNSIAEPFRTCIRLKKKEINLGLKELQNLYGEVHRSVCRMIEIADFGHSKGEK